MINFSEKYFEDYLISNRFSYSKNFVIDSRIDNKNVDFKICLNGISIYSDVKQIDNSPHRKNSEIIAFKQIRKDIKKLRQKFHKKVIDKPIILVSMNASNNFFTGYTVVRAMYGDIVMNLDKENFEQISEIQHSNKGNAEFTKNKNTAISGILIFLPYLNTHYYFVNYYAKRKLPANYFPNVKYLDTSPRKKGNQLINLNKIMIGSNQQY